MNIVLPTVTRAAACMIIAVACVDAPQAPSVAKVPSHVLALDAGARAQIEQALGGRTSRGFEDEILRMEAQIPGLGGVYRDPASGKMVVFLKNVDQQQTALAALRSMRESINVRRGIRDNLGVSGATIVRQGDYSFSELVSWQVLIVSRIRSHGYLEVGADEMQNRVRIVMEPEAPDADAILRSVFALGVPPEAVVVKRRAAPRLSNDLRDRSLPVHGGTQIAIVDTNNVCTLGFPVRVLFHNIKGWLTASHCDDGNNGAGATNQVVRSGLGFLNG